MDIRTDYVRSLSSACYILEMRFESNAGKSAVMHLAVSGGVCFSADGDMKADVIYLYPKQERNDITVGDKSIYSAKDLDELCDLLFDAATIEGWQDPNVDYNAYRAKVNGLTFAIDGRLKCYGSHKELAGRIEQLGGVVSASISSDVDYLICNDPKAVSRKASKARQLDIPFISDFDFMWGSFAKNPCCEDQENRRDDGITASVTDVAPITIANFKYACADAGITLENLMTIMIRNNKFGNRDSAMFILSENDKFEEYRKMYRNASNGQKRSIAEDFIAFVESRW